MSALLLKELIRGKVETLLLSKPGIKDMTVERNADGTVSVKDSGTVSALSMEPDVLDSLSQGIAEAVIEYLKITPIQLTVAVGGVQPGVAVAAGVANGKVLV